MDNLKLSDVKKFESYALDRMKREAAEIVNDIRDNKKITDENEAKLKAQIEIYLADFIRENKA